VNDFTSKDVTTALLYQALIKQQQYIVRYHAEYEIARVED
jgi:hypothetical protein